MTSRAHGYKFNGLSSINHNDYDFYKYSLELFNTSFRLRQASSTRTHRHVRFYTYNFLLDTTREIAMRVMWIQSVEYARTRWNINDPIIVYIDASVVVDLTKWYSNHLPSLDIFSQIRFEKLTNVYFHITFLSNNKNVGLFIYVHSELYRRRDKGCQNYV